MTFNNNYKEQQKEKLIYDQRISTLNHNGNVYAISIILLSQFVFLNFHYILGATLTLIAIISLIVQVTISLIEKYYLEINQYTNVTYILNFHFIINHIINLLYIPFLVWVMVLMYQHANIILATTDSPT